MQSIVSNLSNTGKKRLISLDALRGFNMFWIIGARNIANGLESLNIPGVSALSAQLYHTEWNGFTFYDLIFPMFVFIIGVSISLSMQKRVDSGENRQLIMRHVLKRTIILFVLGLVYNDLFSNLTTPENIRFMGVLQRSAICYFFTSLLVLYTKPRQQVMAIAGILVGYWLTLRFIPVPGYGAGVWTESGNLSHYIDQLLLPGKLDHDTWDSEGVLSTLPAIATCLIGSLSGYWLKFARINHKPINMNRRAFYLLLAGGALAVLGLVISPLFPISKKLWTSSFVLLTGGLSIIFLSGFYWLIDIIGWKRWSFPFVMIGMNSMLIYMATRFLPFDQIVSWFVGKLPFIFGASQDLLIAIGQLIIEVSLLFYLYNRKIFVRI